MTASAEDTLNFELLIAQANEARRDYEDAAKEYRDLRECEERLEAMRPVKAEQIKKLMMDESPSLAATPAEKLSRCHPEYLAYLAEQRETVRRKDDARTRMESAKMRVNLAIAAIKAGIGVI
jgi:hypothetical protein